MPQHPPWLRFQAYVVGLPKTGSTSIATVFGNYRTGHEWALMDLTAAGMARLAGQLCDAQFLAATGTRLVPASLELDSVTSHHLYADLLAERFGNALFVHTVRDVRSWVSSLLEMLLRKRLARLQVDVPYSVWERDYLALMTAGTYRLEHALTEDDAASLVPLMAYWARHMTQLPQMVPAERTIVVPTCQIGQRLGELADFVGVPVGNLRADLAHTNRAPRTLDRMGTYATPQLMAAYRLYCEPIMVDLFPAEHAQWLADYRDALAAPPDRAQLWQDHVGAVAQWVTAAVAEHGAAATR